MQGCAAGVATLEVLRAMSAADWAAVHARGRRLMEGLDAALREHGIVAVSLERQYLRIFHT